MHAPCTYEVRHCSYDEPMMHHCTRHRMYEVRHCTYDEPMMPHCTRHETASRLSHARETGITAVSRRSHTRVTGHHGPLMAVSHRCDHSSRPSHTRDTDHHGCLTAIQDAMSILIAFLQP